MEIVRALIVDDSSVMRKIVARALQQGGIAVGEIKEAANGAEALEIVQPGKSGFGAQRHQHAGDGWTGIRAPAAVASRMPKAFRW